MVVANHFLCSLKVENIKVKKLVAKFNSFEEIVSWQKARELNVLIYRVTNSNDLFSKDFGLKDQIRRASVSISSNIAEGFERDGNREFIQFLSIAKASCGETRSQLYRILDRKYITSETFDALKNKTLVLNKKISAFINYLSKSELKGSKYKNKQP